MSLEVFPGISAGAILVIAVSMACVYALIILYLWPYKIETDSEIPLNWYYPFTCSFWCPKKDNQGHTIRAKTVDEE